MPLRLLWRAGRGRLDGVEDVEESVSCAFRVPIDARVMKVYAGEDLLELEQLVGEFVRKQCAHAFADLAQAGKVVLPQKLDGEVEDSPVERAPGRTAAPRPA